MLETVQPLKTLFRFKLLLILFLCSLLAFLAWRLGPYLIQRIQFVKIAARYDLAELSRPVKPVEGVLIEMRPDEHANAFLDTFDFRQISLFKLLDLQYSRQDVFSQFAEQWTYEGNPKDYAYPHALLGEAFRKTRLGLDRTSFSIEGPLRFWVNHPSHVTIGETCQITITRLKFEFPEARLIERWPRLEHKFEDLFRAARLYEDAVFNFLIHAANEIKEHDCGPDTEKIAEKWQRKATEFRIDTYDGRIFGAELWLI